MKNKLVVGNMKMNMLTSDIGTYLDEINGKINSSQVVICPTSIYVPYFLKHKYKVGLQNTFFRSEGAYTGEISPLQAASMGISYVIIGHSERRNYFEENDSTINKKIIEALKYDLKVILCVGETGEEKNLLKTARVIKRQLINGLRNIEEDKMKNIIIAYEPVWAIGTSVTPTNKDISETADYIKGIIKGIHENSEPLVLYGGSVNEKNIKELNKIAEIDGFLVGGASNDAKKFLKIIEVAVKE